jgi:hypothetical protein
MTTIQAIRKLDFSTSSLLVLMGDYQLCHSIRLLQLCCCQPVVRMWAECVEHGARTIDGLRGVALLLPCTTNNSRSKLETLTT